MAIRQLKSGTFQVYWNNPITKKREGVTVKTREEAEKRDALVKYQLRFDRSAFVRDAPDEAGNDARQDSFEEVFMTFLTEKQPSDKGLKWHLDCMRTPLAEIGEKGISEITREDVERILAREQAKDVKPVTVRDRMKCFRTVFLWAARKGIVEHVPVFPDLPTAHYKKFVPPSVEEIGRMLSVAPEHLARLILIGFNTGVRIGPSEAFKLRWSDVDTTAGVIRVQAALKNLAEPWREVPIRDDMLETLSAWKAADARDGIEYVINYKGRRVTSVKTAWRDMLKKAGITRTIRPYDLRHAFATQALAAGADVGTVARLMGHASTDMVLEYYQHVLTRQKKETVEHLPHVQAPCAQKEEGVTAVQ